MSRSSYWCLTVNNYDDEYLKRFYDLFDGGKLKYFVVGREVGASGTPHLQCYIEYGVRVRLAQVTKDFPGCHAETRKGTSEQAASYCKKDCVFEEKGDISVSKQGKRTDLDRAVEILSSGGTIRDVALELPTTVIKYRRGLEGYRELVQEVYNPCVLPNPVWRWNIRAEKSHVFWGPPGTGKTEYAKFLLPKALFVTHMDDLGRFDAKVYDGIIFDDMSFTHLPREAQIHLVDFDNPRSIHVRYKVANIPAGTVKIFTTNVEQGQIFLGDGAILRRVHYHFLGFD